jgi:hypothetical protein
MLKYVRFWHCVLVDLKPQAQFIIYKVELGDGGWFERDVASVVTYLKALALSVFCDLSSHKAVKAVHCALSGVDKKYTKAFDRSEKN